MDWQPIETAPKDGTRILLSEETFYFGNLVRLGAWFDLSQLMGEKLDPAFPGWINLERTGEEMIIRNQGLVTHWMPLPEPPYWTGRERECVLGEMSVTLGPSVISKDT